MNNLQKDLYKKINRNRNKNELIKQKQKYKVLNFILMILTLFMIVFSIMYFMGTCRESVLMINIFLIATAGTELSITKDKIESLRFQIRHM